MNPITVLVQKLDEAFSIIGSDMGDLEQLQTTDTWSVVRAINEVVARLNAIEARLIALEAK